MHGNEAANYEHMSITVDTYRKLRTRDFSILIAQVRSARAMGKKQGSVTYGTVEQTRLIRCLLYGFSFFIFEVLDVLSGDLKEPTHLSIRVG